MLQSRCLCASLHAYITVRQVFARQQGGHTRLREELEVTHLLEDHSTQAMSNVNNMTLVLCRLALLLAQEASKIRGIQRYRELLAIKEPIGWPAQPGITMQLEEVRNSHG